MPLAILRVSQLNRYLHSLLEGDTRLREVYLRGEIANFARYPSGHVYFSLREGDASVRGVMFRGNAMYLRFVPENGMQVIVRGSVSLYERDGTCQIIAAEIVPAGAGERAVALEQLKRRLEGEGLFAPERHRPLPLRPAVLGVVTSEKGAVIHDIESVVLRKAPDVRLLLAPAAVQGDAAAGQLQAALESLNRDGRSDIIILARGGGSAENLDAFQTEALVRAVAASRIPVISAVGHETDTTLCDLAADCRAATPTAAAEIALGGIPDLPERLAGRRSALCSAMEMSMSGQSEALIDRRERFSALSPMAALSERQNEIESRRETLFSLSRGQLVRGEDELARRADALRHLSPLAVLARGYSITQKNGAALRCAGDVTCGDTIETVLEHGRVLSTVTAVMKENGYEL